MGSQEGANRAPEFRINDLHCPDILPILGVPTIAPPPRSSYEDETGLLTPEKPSAATLETVIKMLGQADVSQL